MNFNTVIVEDVLEGIWVKQTFVNRGFRDQIVCWNQSFCGPFDDDKPMCACVRVSVGLHID